MILLLVRLHFRFPEANHSEFRLSVNGVRPYIPHIPASGYYEWVATAGKKQPYLLYKPDDLLVFAGLWEPWQDRLSFTILTEEARGDLTRIHNRMPVMLNPDQARDWLTQGTEKPETVFASDVYHTVEYHPVSTKVNNVRNQGDILIEPLHDGT